MALDKGLGPHQGPPKTLEEFKAAIGSSGVGANAMWKSVINREDMDIAHRDKRVPVHKEGIHGDRLTEPIPNFEPAPNEKQIAGHNNSWIILGRDRHRDRLDRTPEDPHYAALGHAQCGMIDIVVGRMAKKVVKTKVVNGEVRKIPCHPQFYGDNQDAARIYISQKADIDRYFGFVSGPPGGEDLYPKYEESRGKAAIGIKADAIRIISREGVNIISSADYTNSHGFPKKTIYGINLICATPFPGDEEPVPIAKAPKVARALSRAIDMISKLNGLVDSFLMAQFEYNIALQAHTHFSPFFGAPTSPSIIAINSGTRTSLKLLTKAKAGLLAHKTMLGKYSAHYCQPAGRGWIGSKYNKTN